MNGHDEAAFEAAYGPGEDDWQRAQDDEELTLAIILERDYQRRAAQLREWQRRADEQRAAYRAFEAETLAMMNKMGW